MSIAVLLSALVAMSSVTAFTFSHTEPSECQNMTLRWQGGTPPYYATVVPAYPMTGGRIQNVSIPLTTAGNNTFSFKLNNPANLEFSVIMSDATGWGAGGVTPVLQIASSSDKTCYTTPPPFGFYFYWDPPMGISSAQCQNMRLSWDANVVYPIQALGFVPGAGAFTIPVPQNGTSRTTTWPVNIREGAQYQILMAHSGQVATGGSTNLTWVTSGQGGCLNANSLGAGVRVATVIDTAGSSTMTRSLTSLSPSMSASSRPASDNSGGGMSSGSGTSVGAIAGGVVGGLAALALVVFLFICCRRRRRREQQNQNTETRDTDPEMRQTAPVSTGPAAVMRRATRSVGRRPAEATRSRSSFDILSRPSGVSVTPPPPETPSVDENDDTIDPFVSPFPAPPPRDMSDSRLSTGDSVPWGASRGHLREKSDGTLDTFRPSNGPSQGWNNMGPIAPAFVPLNPSGNRSSLGAGSRKVSVSMTETPPQSPTIRSPPGRASMYRSASSGGMTRWSVDEDEQIGTRSNAGTIGNNGSSLAGVAEGTTFLQHNDGGPGGIVELPPSYDQLRTRNPDE